MTTVPAPKSAPPLLLTLVHDFAQKALTGASVALAAHGVIQTDQKAQFVQLGVSAAMFAVSCLWTCVAVKIRAARLEAAMAAPPAPA